MERFMEVFLEHFREKNLERYFFLIISVTLTI